jgi:hypothetical protein
MPGGRTLRRRSAPPPHPPAVSRLVGVFSRPPPSAPNPPACLPAGTHPRANTPSATMPCRTWRARPRGARNCRAGRSYRPVVSSAHNKSQPIAAVLTALDGGREPERAALRDAVRALLTDLAKQAPGRSVEVRVPPYGAVQCGTGPRHTRGTPPNVVEMDPVTWIRLATGRLTWADALAEGRIQASGNRADLSGYVPVQPWAS